MGKSKKVLLVRKERPRIRLVGISASFEDKPIYTKSFDWWVPRLDLELLQERQLAAGTFEGHVLLVLPDETVCQLHSRHLKIFNTIQCIEMVFSGSLISRINLQLQGELLYEHKAVALDFLL